MKIALHAKKKLYAQEDINSTRVFFSAEHFIGSTMLNIFIHYVNVYNTYPTFQAKY